MVGKLFKRIALCGVILSAIGVVNACSSAPNRVKWIVPGPWGPNEIDAEWEKRSPGIQLPDGWTPGSEYRPELRVDGKIIRPSLCVATNPSNPGCVYIQLGSCNPNSGGWILYCQVIAKERAAYDDNGLLRRCPPEWGSIDFNVVTGFTSASFTMTCGQEDLPTSLVDGVMLTAPDSTPMDAVTFDLVYDGMIPDGTFVEFEGDIEEVVWNSYRFGRNQFSFDSLSGNRIAAAMTWVPGAPPIVVLTVDGVLVDTRVIAKPY